MPLVNAPIPVSAPRGLPQLLLGRWPGRKKAPERSFCFYVFTVEEEGSRREGDECVKGCFPRQKEGSEEAAYDFDSDRAMVSGRLWHIVKFSLETPLSKLKTRGRRSPHYPTPDQAAWRLPYRGNASSICWKGKAHPSAPVLTARASKPT